MVEVHLEGDSLLELKRVSDPCLLLNPRAVPPERYARCDDFWYNLK